MGSEQRRLKVESGCHGEALKLGGPREQAEPALLCSVELRPSASPSGSVLSYAES